MQVSLCSLLQYCRYRGTASCFHVCLQADEELLLLEGVDMAGLGNWAAVAEHVGTKGQDSCRQHYYDIYINSPAFPEPVPAPSMAFIDKLQVGALGSPPVDELHRYAAAFAVFANLTAAALMQQSRCGIATCRLARTG